MQAPAPSDEYITRAKEVLSVPRIQHTYSLPPSLVVSQQVILFPFLFHSFAFFNHIYSHLFHTLTSTVITFVFSSSLPILSSFLSCTRVSLRRHNIFLFVVHSALSVPLFPPGATYSHVLRQTDQIMGAVCCNWLG